MQVEQLHHAPKSISEFLRQYAMIVLSILTALLLEHIAVSFQHGTAAATSRLRIEAELARNAKDLADAEQVNKENMQRVRQILRTLMDQMKAGKPIGAEINTELETLFGGHSEISMPSFQRSAWEAAIADQSASHLDAADLRRYSEIYTAAADSSATWQLLLGGEWLTHFAELLLDYRLGKVDQRNLANLLARFLFAGEQIEKGEESLSELIAGHPAPDPMR